MLVRAFRQHRPAVLLLLVILAALPWAGAWYGGEVLPALPRMPLYQPLELLFGRWPWSYWLVGWMATMGLALQVDGLAFRTELFERPNHLPALLLPLLLAMGPGPLGCDPALIAMPLVLMAMGMVWGSQGRAKVLGVLFDVGLLLGLAALVHLPYAFLLVVVWAGLAVMRPWAWREYMVPVLGLAVVFFLAWGFMRLTGLGYWAPGSTLAITTGQTPAYDHIFRDRMGPVIILLLLPVAVVAFARVYGRSIMREKNVRASFLAFTFTCVLLALFEWLVHGRVPGALVACPLAVLLAYALVGSKRSALSEVVVYGLLVVALLGQWLG